MSVRAYIINAIDDRSVADDIFKLILWIYSFLILIKISTNLLFKGSIANGGTMLTLFTDAYMSLGWFVRGVAIISTRLPGQDILSIHISLSKCGATHSWLVNYLFWTLTFSLFVGFRLKFSNSPHSRSFHATAKIDHRYHHSPFYLNHFVFINES